MERLRRTFLIEGKTCNDLAKGERDTLGLQLCSGQWKSGEGQEMKWDR